jgi:hypothetical protein
MDWKYWAIKQIQYYGSCNTMDFILCLMAGGGQYAKTNRLDVFVNCRRAPSGGGNIYYFYCGAILPFLAHFTVFVGGFFFTVFFWGGLFTLLIAF